MGQDVRAHRCHRGFGEGTRGGAGEHVHGPSEHVFPEAYLERQKSIDRYTENEPQCRKLNENQILFQLKSQNHKTITDFQQNESQNPASA